ncbi:MAG: substrate-binding domain-containing protein [Planctomycetota bacterium]|jgi:D-xylose transport system substrate-binding protein|nr:substrate-binding domain-containing protein [Planctomycetota bacterium]
MKKILAASLFVLAFSGRPACPADKIAIGLAMPTMQEERWVRDLRVMQAEGAKLGIEIRSAVARTNQEQQNSQVDSMLNQGIQALIIAPHDGKTAAAAVAAARAKGVPVISYDRLVLDAEVDVYISFDNVKVGQLQGEWLTRKAPTGTYAVLSGSPTDNNAKLFRAGAMEFIQPLADKGAIRIVMDQPVPDWRPDNAQRLIEKALGDAGGKIDAILAPNDGTAGGAVSALEAVGLAGKVPVTGQDSDLAAVRRILRGHQGMTVFKDTRRLGEAAVQIALKLARKQSVADEIKGRGIDNGRLAVPAILLEPVAVDADNLEKVLVESGYIKQADLQEK